MFTRILVPTDFSATSDTALEYARGLTERFGAALHLVHVLEEPLVATLGNALELPEAPEYRTAVVVDAQTRLAHRAYPRASAQPLATTKVIPGTAASAIVNYAAEHAVDLIVMGTHGRTGMAHLMVGSVAEQVVRSAPCPVLTVRLHPLPVEQPGDMPVAAAVAR